MLKRLTGLITAFLVVFNSLFSFISGSIPSSVKKIIQAPVVGRLLTKSLKVGSTGEDVLLLQSALATDKRLYPQKLLTGYYGALTKEAVTKFQQVYGISKTGEVDSTTLDKFNEVFGTKSREYYLGTYPTIAPILIKYPNTVDDDTTPWGVAQKVPGDDVTYTMKVGQDEQMGTAQEIFDALNAYRRVKGVGTLSWDANLATYAQERANYYNQYGVDAHEGFKKYTEDTNNVKKLGFYMLGENGSLGYRLSGTHLIEWVFASDEGHDNNQKDPRWSDVGVGVSGTGVDIIFGGDRM